MTFTRNLHHLASQCVAWLENRGVVDTVPHHMVLWLGMGMVQHVAGWEMPLQRQGASQVCGGRKHRDDCTSGVPVTADQGADDVPRNVRSPLQTREHRPCEFLWAPSLRIPGLPVSVRVAPCNETWCTILCPGTLRWPQLSLICQILPVEPVTIAALEQTLCQSVVHHFQFHFPLHHSSAL